MNNTDPLANLRDIHLPGDVGWWPLATGWWALIVIVIALSAWFIYRYIKKHKRAAIQREVMATLNSIDSTFATNHDAKQLLTNYSQLLRRLVIHHRGRKDGAALTGNAWLGLLLEYQPASEQADSQLRLLTEGLYQAELEIDQPEALQQWVRQCAQSICQTIIRGAQHA